jgi:mono/diheme cytochrome c family protein
MSYTNETTAANARTVGPAVTRVWWPLLLIAANTGFAAEADLAGYRTEVAPFLKRHCYDCHGADAAEAGLSLPDLDANLITGGHADTWGKVLEQLSLGQMPPKDESRPDPQAADRVIGWIKQELTKGGHHFEDKLQLPGFGNYVPHEQLFDRPPTEPSFSPPRYWRVRPAVYKEAIDKLSRGKKLPKPFGLDATGGGFADYAGVYRIDGPNVDLLLGNAQAVATFLSGYKMENGTIRAAGWGVPNQLLKIIDPNNQTPDDEQVDAAIDWLFHNILQRDPNDEERTRLVTFFRNGCDKVGRQRAVRNMVAAVLLAPEALYRVELGGGAPDEYGRVMLSPRELAYAIAYALTDQRPDDALLRAAEDGTLQTREDVEREVTRLLEDTKTPKPRILSFFHEYFGYTKAKDVFKDQKLNPDHRVDELIEDTDRLVLYLLEKDQDVLRELLTTNRSFVNARNHTSQMVHTSYNLPLDWKWTANQPIELPKNQRAGILTQPAWLVARSGNFDNDPVRRGKWVRQKLLGGTIPDVPITVNAQLPDEPHNTLRERMRVTREEFCWKCHVKMDPLGIAFENYDHFGRWRLTEVVQDREATEKNVDDKGNSRGPVMQEVPADASGEIIGSGDGKIDGKVNNSVDMIHRIAGSERVRQVFVRHAFRYWMGRNESLADAATLQRADKAYVESGGSMRALITSLLTSDSFLYRKPKI